MIVGEEGNQQTPLASVPPQLIEGEDFFQKGMR